jgi:hypothetical protein
MPEVHHMWTMLICIEFERMKRLLNTAERCRSIATEKADLQGAKAASENMTMLSDLIFDHVLKCEICDGTITWQYRDAQ